MIERMTSQKEIILKYLKSTTSHPSAEDIYLEVRKELPRISLGTVYRILATFKNKKKIIEIAHEVSRYDANTDPHSHFICESCDNIYDIEIPNFKKNINKRGHNKASCLKKIFGDFIKVGKINNYQIYFYGKCKKCSKK
ncbi:MAG: transcriptional repressor [Candidatus Pacebacteria bacterium]|nr:transcriptional repressor [Candidatus Paceibacterota bacterium]